MPCLCQSQKVIILLLRHIGHCCNIHYNLNHIQLHQNSDQFHANSCSDAETCRTGFIQCFLDNLSTAESMKMKICACRLGRLIGAATPNACARVQVNNKLGACSMCADEFKAGACAGQHRDRPLHWCSYSQCAWATCRSAPHGASASLLKGLGCLS